MTVEGDQLAVPRTSQPKPLDSEKPSSRPSVSQTSSTYSNLCHFCGDQLANTQPRRGWR